MGLALEYQGRIFNAHAGGLFIISGDDIVYTDFGGGDVGGAGEVLTGLIDEIITDYHEISIGLFLLGVELSRPNGQK